MMIVFFLIVACMPVLFIGYPPGSDRRGVAGLPSRGLFDPIAAVFADVEVPKDRADPRRATGEHRRA